MKKVLAYFAGMLIGLAAGIALGPTVQTWGRKQIDALLYGSSASSEASGTASAASSASASESSASSLSSEGKTEESEYLHKITTKDEFWTSWPVSHKGSTEAKTPKFTLVLLAHENPSSYYDTDGDASNDADYRGFKDAALAYYEGTLRTTDDDATEIAFCYAPLKDGENPDLLIKDWGTDTSHASDANRITKKVGLTKAAHTDYFSVDEDMSILTLAPVSDTDPALKFKVVNMKETYKTMLTAWSAGGKIINTTIPTYTE